MAKTIPKISSRRNGCISSRNGARRIPKGVIHVQASFNNTIVTVTDVRGLVVSWSSPGPSGFKGTRRGTPFAAQTTTTNVIRTVVDQGQADTIGIAMRRALLGKIKGTCITRVKSEKVPHEYSTIMGIQESVHEILMNLKEIVLRNNLYGSSDASICVKGPGYVIAQDIILPP
ncbi:30S ribosomal protein S11, chloroplastic-like [Solanum verrucosum]|uniref:30S ribosomal protein S11, chloroplastic-like n=1 Tax=Solanum verrucosum TaxID=315347 RepID=UPI0020D00210|nr:30S ribosomal protein S11, chloroplastic-like [Solanum verrucosum]